MREKEAKRWYEEREMDSRKVGARKENRKTLEGGKKSKVIEETEDPF